MKIIKNIIIQMNYVKRLKQKDPNKNDDEIIPIIEISNNDNELIPINKI